MTRLSYLGRPVHVRVVRNRGTLLLSQDVHHCLILQVPEGVSESAPSLFLQGLMTPFDPVIRSEQQLLVFLQNTAGALCHDLGVNIPNIQLFHSSKLWGNCDWEHNVIHIHHRLVTFPDSVIREALLHECCHLLIHDHRPTFWQLMTQFMPDWPYQQGLLRQNKRKAGAE